MIELVYARVADLLTAEVEPCFVGDPPENVPVPYLFVWGPLPVGRALSAAGCDDTVDTVLHVQVVAKQSPDVLVLAGRVSRALQGFTVDVDGWAVFPLKVTGSTNVQTARGVANEASNTYPAWLTLSVRLQATKEGTP